MKASMVLLCVIFLFTGCSQSVSTELSNRLIIEAIGIDTNENGCKVSVLALNTLQTGSANSTETPDGIAKVFSATGTNLADAFAQIDLISSQIPLYSQARVLVLGKEFAENQPLSSLNFFIREYTTRDDILVAVSETTASKIISADLGENLLTSKAIKNLLLSGERNALTVAVPFYKFISNLLNETQAAFLPILKTEKNDKDKDEIKSAGIALFAGENYSATIEEDKMQGLLWATNRIQSALLEVRYDNKNISLAVRKAKTKVKENKEVPNSFGIDVTFSCDIIEHNSILQEFTQEDISQIAALAEQKVKEEIENFLLFSLQKNGCDCVGFARRIINKKPEMSETIIKNTTSFFKTIKTEVTANAQILRTGREVLQKN